MIPRRLYEHVRAHNWFAVAIDFVIVVGGVFVGLQVNNWNAARTERASERAFLEAVRDDIRNDADDTRGYISTYAVVAKSGARALQSLDDPAPCAGDCWRRVADFFLASQWINVRSDRAVFDEIKRSGVPKDRALRAKLTRYYGLNEQLLPITLELPAFRALVRSSVPLSVQDYFWTMCFRAAGRQQFFDEGCKAPLADDEARAIVERLKAAPQTRPTLTYWHSTVTGASTMLASQVADAEATITEIDKYLGARK